LPRIWEEGTRSGFDQVAPAERLSRPLLPASSVKGRRSRSTSGGCQGPAGEGDWADRVRDRDRFDCRQNARSDRDDAVRSGLASSSSKPS
jgi:hypothetical protein